MLPSSDADALAAAAAELLGRDVTAVRTLSGGQHAQTIVVDDGSAHLVVRRFPRGDDAVRREVEVLRRLEPLRDLAPRLVAHGGDPEHPVIVTTLLQGGAPGAGLDPMAIAVAMGSALARVHALDGAGLPSNPPGPPSGDGPLARRSRAGWGELRLDDPVLLHTDFWSGNAVWRGETLTGIVDWSSGSHGPRGVDVAWCRQDLVLLGSPEAAEAVLRTYERSAGVTIDDIHAWDVHAGARAEARVEEWAPNYAGIGRPGITAAVLRRRLDRWNAAL